MKESELQDAIESLPHSIQPTNDLWPNINERLCSAEASSQLPTKTPLWRTPAMAAAVLLALTSGIFIGRGLDTNNASSAAQLVYEHAFLGTVDATEREYQAAFLELVPLDYSGLQLEGAEPDALRGSWEDLLQTETSLLAALREHPTNIYLNEKLLDLRSAQLHFVKQLALLEQKNWRRT